MTKYIWNEISEVEKKIRSASFILLLLDYDGTLIKIKKDPHKASLPRATKNILNKIKVANKLTLGVVSGRGVYDIRKQVGIDDIVYAGNHGLEWEISKKIYVMPGISKTRELYLTILSTFSDLEKKYKGIVIEDKNLTLSFHYRMVDKKKQQKFIDAFEEFIKPYLKTKLIEVVRNKMVFDILPNVNWGKGSFINWLIKTKKSNPLTIYIGDDRTDEDAFSELKDAITIKVGKGETHANYFVNDIEDTSKFLLWFDKVLS
jgi:trehalose 6-phosphate phosphatase